MVTHEFIACKNNFIIIELYPLKIVTKQGKSAWKRISKTASMGMNISEDGLQTVWKLKNKNLTSNLYFDQSNKRRTN